MFEARKIAMFEWSMIDFATFLVGYDIKVLYTTKWHDIFILYCFDLKDPIALKLKMKLVSTILFTECSLSLSEDKVVRPPR